ncbi:MAG: M23 family metallopeptidase [Candidatus Kerfeldbacteria bacterium]|nr:M23 family metallopeptidase [Candidatus Kerfeldbacteria bacterium]
MQQRILAKVLIGFIVVSLGGLALVLSGCFDQKGTPVSPSGHDDTSMTDTKHPMPVTTGLTRTSTGFYYPVGWTVSGNGNWYTCGADYYPNKRHLGTDIMCGVGTPIYAVAAGTIVKRGDGADSWGTGNCALVIEHTFRDPAGRICPMCPAHFCAVYGHIRSSLRVGQTVSAGQYLGTVGPYSGGNHLHFGVWPGPTSQFPSSGWGIASDPGCAGVGTNFRAPITFITTKYPG